MKDNYLRRQAFMLSNLGIFYLIIIALFAVPLFGTLVVVIIKGVLDFRYAILAAALIGSGIGIFYAGKGAIHLFRAFRRDGADALGVVREGASRGQTMQLELFGGCVRFSSGGGDGRRATLPDSDGEVRLLTDGLETPAQQGATERDPISQMKLLADMKKDGSITDDEFALLKRLLIESAEKNGVSTASAFSGKSTAEMAEKRADNDTDDLPDD